METWMFIFLIVGVIAFFIMIAFIMIMAKRMGSDTIVWNLCTGEDGVLIRKEQSRKPGCTTVIFKPTGLEHLFTEKRWPDIPDNGIITSNGSDVGGPEQLMVILWDGTDRKPLGFEKIAATISGLEDEVKLAQTSLVAKEQEKKLLMNQPAKAAQHWSNLLEEINKDRKTLQQSRFPEGFRRP